MPNDVVPTPEPARRRSPAWAPILWSAVAALLLLSAALLLYLPDFPPGPVMDDGSVSLENPAVHSAGDWLTAAFFTDTYRPIWRPLALLSFKWNWATWPAGRREAAVVNLLLLGVVALLAAAVMRRIGFGRVTAAVAALVFLVQPFLAESVVRLAGRSELLCIAFMLAAMWVHADWVRRGAGVSAVRSVLYAIAWGAGLLGALLSKEIALVLPLLALGYELAHPQGATPGAHRRVRRLIVLAVVSVVIIGSWSAYREGVLRGWPHEMKRNPAPDYVHALTTKERLRFALSLPVHYGAMLIGTAPLLPEYSYLLAWPEEAPPVELGNPSSFGVGQPPLARTVAGTALVAAALVGFALLRRKRPRVALGLWWAAITLLATLPILESYGHVASARNLALPLIGIVVALAALAERWVTSSGESPSPPQRVRAGLVGVVVIALLFVSAARTRAALEPWESQESLMTYLEEQAPMSPEVPLYRGLQAIHRRDMEHATARMEESIALFPRNARALLNLGILYRSQGRNSVAGRVLYDAVTVADRLVPKTAVAAQAHIVLGAFLGEQDLQEEALDQYLAAVEADSTNIHALARAGALEALSYRTARSGIRHIRRALELDRMGELGPLADHIRETAARAERYLRILDGDEQGFDRMMEPSEDAGGRDQEPPPE